MIAPEKLAEWKGLAGKATPSPWTIPDDYTHTLDSAVQECLVQCWSDDDAAFIAAARQAVPELVGEVERLRSALVAIASVPNDHLHDVTDCTGAAREALGWGGR